MRPPAGLLCARSLAKANCSRCNAKLALLLVLRATDAVPLPGYGQLLARDNGRIWWPLNQGRGQAVQDVVLAHQELLDLELAQNGPQHRRSADDHVGAVRLGQELPSLLDGGAAQLRE